MKDRTGTVADVADTSCSAGSLDYILDLDHSCYSTNDSHNLNEKVAVVAAAVVAWGSSGSSDSCLP